MQLSSKCGIRKIIIFQAFFLDIKSYVSAWTKQLVYLPIIRRYV